MRLFLLALALLGSNVGFGSVAGTNSADHGRLDPTVVGGSIPDQHKLAWHERRKAWDECKNCFLLQEFPGEG